MLFGYKNKMKPLITTLLCLAIITPTAACLFLGVQNHKIRQENLSLRTDQEGGGPALPVLGDSQGQKQEPPADKETGGQENVPELAYQALYPELYAQRPKGTIKPDHVIYLTFDDGPSDRTIEILDTLKQYGIKATFFVTGKSDEHSKAILRRIVEEGHTIGIHTYTHVYTDIYSSVEAYLEDFNQIYQLIEETTGVKTQIFRFPGGSINSYNGQLYQELIAEMTRRGFVFYDWNISSGDAAGKHTKESVLASVVQNTVGKKRGIVLMHDSKPMVDTAAALPAMIEELKAQGFYFEALTNQVEPIAFPYPKVK